MEATSITANGASYKVKKLVKKRKRAKEGCEKKPPN
jgi:hypothetical protein